MVKFSKSLSFGIGVACFSSMILLSSCSKEDAQVPQPESAVLNEGSNLKTNLIGSGYGLSSPSIPTTDGTTCQNCFATGWSKEIIEGVPGEPVMDSPAGTSNLSTLWGNTFIKWLLPLSAPEGANSGSILTVTSSKKIAPDYAPIPSMYPTYEEHRSKVTTKIKYLKPGKKYAVTFQVATTSANLSGSSTSYAEGAQVTIGTPSGSWSTQINLIGKKAQWITKTVEFVAENTEAKFSFQAYIPTEVDKFCVAHIYVGKNAVKEIN